MSEGNLASIGKNIITTSPYTVYQAGILATIVSGDPKYALFTGLAFIMGDAFNAGEKLLSKKILGENSSIGQRPNGCGNGYLDSDCTGCGIYPSTTKSLTWGMPSGHAQITSFAASYWTIYLWMKYLNETDIEAKKVAKNHAIVSTIIMWVLAACVWSQRVISMCHSILQIIAGVLFGTILGFIGYFISTLIIKEMPKIVFSSQSIE
jgi:hypothetical protein